MCSQGARFAKGTRHVCTLWVRWETTRHTPRIPLCIRAIQEHPGGAVTPNCSEEGLPPKCTEVTLSNATKTVIVTDHTLCELVSKSRTTKKPTETGEREHG